MEAVITGASSGIGKAIAFQLADNGFHLHLIGRNQEKLEKVSTQITKRNKSCKVNIIIANFLDKLSIDNAISAVNHLSKKINIFVHSAADYKTGKLLLDDGHLLEEQMQCQVTGLHQFLSGILPNLKKYNNSHVFVIGSVASQSPMLKAAQYSIAKSSQEAYCKIMADELRDYGIRLTLIAPGSVNTPSWDGEDVVRNMFVQPEDIANVICNSLTLSPEAWLEKITIRPRQKNY